MSATSNTFFLPSERSSDDALRAQIACFSSVSTHLRQMLSATSDVLVVLNEDRQIVYANDRLTDLTEKPADKSLGERTGEAMGCLHAWASEGGCGTSEFCRTCGAAHAFVASNRREPAIRECHILRDAGRAALDLRVRACPIVVDEHHFVVFALENTAHEKRREVLERVFYHDLLNVAANLKGHSELLGDEAAQEAIDVQGTIRSLTAELIEQIGMQQDLLAAEAGTVRVLEADIDVAVLLTDVARSFQQLTISQGCTVKLESEPLTIRSDRRLLGRVLSNMLKNAIEASSEGDVVTLAARPCGEQIEFWCHNAGYMPRSVQLQLFHRSFSTKGTGRGIGTYSMHQLTRTWLGGEIDFASDHETGTTFRVRLPRGGGCA